MNPVKPNKIVEKLFSMQPIKSMKVSSRMISEDDSVSEYSFGGANGSVCTLSYGNAMLYLNFRPQHNSVCSLKSEYFDQMLTWLEFEKQHAAEIAELRRLKAKYGDV